MSYVFTPRYPFDCPGCDRLLPKGWMPGIGFDDEGTLLCADCLDGADVADAVPAKSDQPNLAGVPTNRLGRVAPTCDECGLNHRGAC